MIRKPPLRTYQKKKNAQSSFCYSQSSSREPRSFSKKISTNGNKNKPQPPQDDKDIDEFSFGYLDSTFDRIAKDVRLPTPPPQESHSSLNISSDAPPQELSPVKNDKYEASWTREPTRTRDGKRARRKPGQSRTVYLETEVVVKKRLKHDLVNTSTKKVKAVRSSRRKVPNKNTKNLIRGKEKDRIDPQALNLNNSEDWFLVLSTESNEVIENGKKQENGCPSSREQNVDKISNLSSSGDSDSTINRDVDIDKAKNKKKIKTKNIVERRKANRKKFEVSVPFDNVLKEINDFSKLKGNNKNPKERNCSVENSSMKNNDKSSFVDSRLSVNTKKMGVGTNKIKRKMTKRSPPAFEFVSNFQTYSASISRENNDEDPVDSNKYNRILNREEYMNRMQSKLMDKNNSPTKAIDPLDNSNHSEPSNKNITEKKDLATKPCSILLLKCNENPKLMLVTTRCSIVSESCNMQTSEDIFQSSISNAISDVEMRLHESAGNQEVQLIENRSDFNENLDLNMSKKSSEVKFSKESMKKKQTYDPKRSLKYLQCSTPINVHVKIDRTINCLSPIIASDERSQKNKEFVDEEANETSVVNCTGSESKKCSHSPKTNTRSGAKKRLSISYEEDNSLEISDEYCKESSIEKMPIDNVANQYGNERQTQSPTSQIQESLEILKLNLGNRVNKCNTNDEDKPRLSMKGITSMGDNGSNKIFESTNEFTSQFKDTCSQLTPTGIITTRSGRQLKLSLTTQKKFFNDSNDSRIHSDNEIMNDSETAKNRSLRSRVTKRRGNQFIATKSLSEGNTSDHKHSFNSTDNYSPRMKPDNNSAKLQTWNNSMTNEPMSSNTSRKLNTSESSSKDFEKSVLDNNKRSKRRSAATALQNAYTTMLSSEEISQSILESTKNLDSLNIRSQVDVNAKTLGNDEETNASEWSTLSGSVSVDSASSDRQEKITEVFCDDNKSRNLSGSLISDQNESDIDPLSDASNQRSKSPPEFSPKYTELALADRMKLLSTRINTRKRRKTFMKPANENISQVFEEQSAIQISNDSKLTNLLDVRSTSSFNQKEEKEIGDIAADSFDEQKEDSEIFKVPLYVNLNADLQPRVLLEKLKDPPEIERNRKTISDIEESVDLEISNRSLKIISRNSNESFIIPDMMINDTDVNKNEEDFEESDPLYCSPDISGTDNLLSKENTSSTSHSDSGTPKSDVNISALIKKQSTLSSLHKFVLTRSEQANSIERNSCPEAKRSKPKEYRQRNFMLAWTSATASQNRQSVLSALRQSILTRSKEATSSPEKDESKASCNGENLDVSDSTLIQRPSLFLKPGKEWARSLSILNNISNASDLEQLSTGKGKNWRQSVQAIITRQQEGLLQSCLGKNQDGKDRRTRFSALNCTSIPDGTPCSQEQNMGSTSPSRFIKRMSIRVIPDNNRLSKIADTSFLEAYGITSSKSRQTLSTTSELESGEKTLTCNLQTEDAPSDAVNTERVVTARDVVLQRCDQDDYLPFSKCFPSEYLDHCRKIGEGVYGEVFLYKNQTEKSVIKIIPIEGEALVNGERQKRFDEILSEIVIAKELHNLRNGNKYQTHGFVEVKSIRCIKGKYPEKLIDLWKAYDNDKGSDNDCPTMFKQNQLYIVLELGHGGEDLEAFVFRSAAEAYALLVQTALALAVAEQSLEFEHRDLHWGNVLISETKESEVIYKLNDKEYTCSTKGLQVAIIDFTLSRMSYDGCCIFNDLALDPALFTAQGEYQFEIYRLMRDTVGNDWQRFEPYTNILWLHYTIDKMLTSLRYKKKYAREHREAIYCLHELKEIVLNYQSAYDFVTNCEKITNLQCKSTSEEIITIVL